MPNYQHGKIYRIESPSHPEINPYYGSTTESLKRRFGKHRSKNNQCTAKQIIAFDDAQIVLVEEYPCQTKNELVKREAHYIRNFPCVNRVVPLRTDKEYNTMYKQMHREKIRKYQNETMFCYCGADHARKNRARHLMTQKHTHFEDHLNAIAPELNDTLDLIRRMIHGNREP
mgnify:CR=1 FL=1